MPNISMPNGDVVSFPDDMPRDQIKGMIASKFPEISGVSPKTSPDTFDTVSDQALQGATFGLGNRAQAGLAALVASGINGKPLAENYKSARDVGSQRLSEEMTQNPKTAIAANIGGALATGGLGADTAAGSAIANSLRSGGTAARIGKGTVAGAASGAAYGAGTAGYDKSLEGAKSGAVSGAVVGGAIPAVGALAGSALEGGKNAITGAMARGPEELGQASQALKDTASQSYQAMRNAGATLNRAGISKVTYNIGKTLSDTGLMNKSLHGDTMSVVDDLNNAAQSGNMDLEKLDQYRQLLNQVVKKNTSKIDGMNPDAFKAQKAISALDDVVNNLGKQDLSNGSSQAITALNDARSAWNKYTKFDRISGIVENADGDANKIKQGLNNFLKNPENIRGFTSDEISSLQEAAKSTAPEKILKVWGRFGFSSSNVFMPSVGGAGAVATLGTPAGAGLVAGGTAARQIGNALARGKAENLLGTIEGKTSGSSQAVSPLLSGLGGGAAAIAEKPQPISPSMPVSPPQVSAPIPPQSNNKTALFDRVMAQESGGKQFNAKGNPLISSKGAVGISQIMPGTAYDAAKIAGLPYDPKKIYTDQNYNAALGKAYLSKMVEKYQGNEQLALMAYNWGQGNVDKWLKSGANPDRIPAETKNYIQKILGS